MVYVFLQKLCKSKNCNLISKKPLSGNFMGAPLSGFVKVPEGTDSGTIGGTWVPRNYECLPDNLLSGWRPGNGWEIQIKRTVVLFVHLRLVIKFQLEILILKKKSHLGVLNCKKLKYKPFMWVKYFSFPRIDPLFFIFF